MWSLLSKNPGDAVYGTIAVGALLAAESPRRETYPKTIAAVVVILVLYWAAHSYADVTGQRLESGGRLTLERALATLRHEVTILIGAAVPLLTLLICWAVGTSLSGAVRAAVWTSAAIIVMIEVIAGLRARLTGRQLFVQTLAGGVLGALVLLLRVILH
jgi:hypothetical protein